MPPLQKQSTVLPILGLDTHVDPKNAPPGTLDIAENIILKRLGLSGVEARKRFGVTALVKTRSSGGNLSSASRLATYNDERLLLGDSSLWSYSPQFTTWMQKGSASAVNVTADALISTRESNQMPDEAVLGNLKVMVFTNTSSVGVIVIDLNTGEKILTQTNLTGTDPRVVALASSFIIFASNGANLIAYKISTSTPTTISGSSNVAATLNGSTRYDVVRNGSNDSVLVAHHTTTPNIRVAVWNSNQTLGNTSTIAEDAGQAIAWLTWDNSDGNAYLGHVSAATGTKVSSILTGATPTVNGTTTCDAALVAVRNIAGFRDGPNTTSFVIAEISAASTFNTRLKWTSTGPVAAQEFQGGRGRSVGLGSRVFKQGSTFYVLLAYESSLQSTYLLTDMSTSSGSLFFNHLLAKNFYGLGGGLTKSAVSRLPTPCSIGSSVVSIPGLRLSMFASRTPGSFVGFMLWDLKFDFSGSGISTPRKLGGMLHIPGGNVRCYGGDTAVELGFHLFPEQPTLTGSAAGGSLTATGTYIYYVVYTWFDEQGQVHQSAPSAAKTITLTGGQNRVILDIPTLRQTDKQLIAAATTGNAPLVDVYRTVSGGTTPYKITSQTSQFANDATVDTVQLIDTTADSAITGNQQLYTLGGVLPHIAPPSAKIAELFNGRIILTGTENPNDFWVSNRFVPGEGVSFSDALVGQLESDGGPITGAMEMDGRFYFFKKDRIYVISGTGPTLNGDNMYDPPEVVSRSIGAIDQRGIIASKDGIFFKSKRGLYLLPRGGGLPVRMEPMEAFDTNTVTGAAVVDDLCQVRFVTAEGRTMVYHWDLKAENGLGRWTTFTGQAAADCIAWNNRFVYVASDGTVQEEVSGQYADNGSNINAKLRWTWVELAQLFGRCRLYTVEFMGEIMASFTLSKTIAYNFGSADYSPETDTLAVTVASIAPLIVQPTIEKNEAVQLTLQETSSVEGFRVSALGLEVGLKGGAQKQPAGQRLL